MRYPIIRGAWWCLASFAAAQAQQIQYKGTFLRHDYSSTVTQACPNAIVNTGSSTSTTRRLLLAVGSFSCPSVTFNGTFTVDHPAEYSATVGGDQAIPAGTPGRLSTTFTGNATLSSPGANPRVHNFWIDLTITGLASGVCTEGTPSRSESTNVAGQGFNMAANVGCAVPRLTIDPSSRKTSGGVLTEFQVVVTSRIVADSGHEGARCCSQRGGKQEISVRTFYRFEIERGDPSGQVSSANRIDPAGVLDDRYEHAVVREGTGLDTGCRFDDSGKIEIRIPVQRYVAKTKGDGTLDLPAALVARDVVGSVARLRLAVFDVDDKAALVGTRKPEIDKVTFNGQQVFDSAGQDWLTGADQQWSLNEFIVPIELVRFPAQPGDFPSGQTLAVANTVTIEIDTQNESQWCTEVDWAALTISAIAPIVLVHGTNAQHDTWELAVAGNGILQSPVQTLTERQVPFEHRIDMEPNGSFDTNATILGGLLRNQAKRFGTDRLHIIAHSKGASDSRRFLARSGGRPLQADGTPLRILSLFALGTPSRGTSISDLAVAVDNDFSAPDLTLTAAGAQAQLGAFAGQTPLDPARRLQTTRSMDGPGGFNDTTPKAPGIPYYSIAGDADRNGNREIDLGEEIEGFFPSSALTIPGNLLYQVLGQYQHIDFQAVQAGPDLQVSLLQPVPTDAFKSNDLVSTTESVHCLRCGFTPLTTLRLNHTTLKSREVMNHIVDVIGFLYPLDKGGL